MAFSLLCDHSENGLLILSQGALCFSHLPRGDILSHHALGRCSFQETRLEAALLQDSCFSPCFQVPALTSLPDAICSSPNKNPLFLGIVLTTYNRNLTYTWVPSILTSWIVNHKNQGRKSYELMGIVKCQNLVPYLSLHIPKATN